MLVLLRLNGIAQYADAESDTIDFDEAKWSYNWNARLSPHIWFVGFTGSIVRPPEEEENIPTQLPAEDTLFSIDIGFQDISPAIKFIIMFSGEFNSKHIVARFNYSGLILDGNAITPYEVLLRNVRFKLDHHAGDVAVGYKILKHPKVNLDPHIGIKFAYMKIGLASDLADIIPVRGARSRFWIDPSFGLKLKYIPHPRTEFSAYADIGGFAIGSELSYQFIGLINLICHKNFYVSGGYRLWSFRAKREEAIYNGRIRGGLLKIGVQF
jgi:hypothetical protein